MNRLDFLIQYLLSEESKYSEMSVPELLQDKRDLFRALRNVRAPLPLSDEFLRLQDEELQAQLAEKGVVRLSQIPPLDSTLSMPGIKLWQGDITRLEVDAVVKTSPALGATPVRASRGTQLPPLPGEPPPRPAPTAPASNPTPVPVPAQESASFPDPRPLLACL